MITPAVQKTRILQAEPEAQMPMDLQIPRIMEIMDIRMAQIAVALITEMLQDIRRSNYEHTHSRYYYSRLQTGYKI